MNVALIPGSSRGIGLAAAIALAAEGFAVALNGPFDDEELEGAVAEIPDAGGNAIKAPFDVSDLQAHDRALSRIEETLGPLTTLVNNAGVGVLSRGDPLKVSEESWDSCLTINAKAAFDGEVYPVNPRAKTILGRRVYPALADIPGAIDLVAVVVPCHFVSESAPLVVNTDHFECRHVYICVENTQCVKNKKNTHTKNVPTTTSCCR